MPYYATLDVNDGGTPKGERTFTCVEVEVGRCGDGIELEDDAFGSDDFHVLILPEGVFALQEWGEGKLALNGAPVKKQARLKVGDVITQGNSTITVKAIGEAAELPEEGAKYLAIDILDKCPHCGGGLPMNGLLDEVLCGACLKTCHPKADYWESVLEDPIDDYHEGAGAFSLNFQTNVRWKAARPNCAKCREELPVQDIPDGATHDVHCPSCGAANTTYPAPDWLAPVLPAVRQVFCGERAAAGGAAAIPTGSARPVILSCPGCKGSLKIASDSARTVTCQYCGSDVYLPDDLWSRLHPVKTAVTWYFRTAGMSKKQLEADARRATDIEEARQKLGRSVETARVEKRSKAMGVFLPIGIAATVLTAIVVGALVDAAGPDAADPAVQPAGSNWSPDPLQPVRANAGAQWFSLLAPGTIPVTDGTAVTWDNPANGGGRARLFVRVAGVAATPADQPQASALAVGASGQRVSRLGQVPGGFSVALGGAGASRVEHVAYKSRTGLPPGSPGLECRAILQTSDGSALAAAEQAESYLNQICGTLTPQ
jgi:ribosomal protein S27E